jgi:hypothetical protein
MFLIEVKCLGVTSIPQPVGPPFRAGYDLGPMPNMSIDHGGRFSFAGRTQRQSVGGKRKVKVDLQGRFVTSSKASISLTIGYGHCGTTHVTVRPA